MLWKLKVPLLLSTFWNKGFQLICMIKKEKSPLAVAAKNGCFHIVKILVNAGADIFSATEELDEFAKQNEDFYIYYQTLKTKFKSTPISEEEAVDESQGIEN
ncbi:uncharacterized protein LOC123009954 [Tribolium madens]|uniref:uncharacterized protein LOC123009954 n=1 Tax=Tribolium madens TaxID=41895 RepID=UPI001CF73500|nr:uncharacterized protein LOC123009954 [Tribolium madens]